MRLKTRQNVSITKGKWGISTDFYHSRRHEAGVWPGFIFVSETFRGLLFCALWLCFVQGYRPAKTSKRDLMRRNAAVLSFTLVPSREPRGTQPRKTLDISEGLARAAPVSSAATVGEDERTIQIHKPCCTGKLCLKCFFTTPTSLCLFFCFYFVGLLKLWCQPFAATEVKHLKPMSNTSIHADSSCCWTLGSSSQPDTSLWEEWVRCVPPRLAGGRIGDIFRMTRGAHALK